MDKLVTYRMLQLADLDAVCAIEQASFPLPWSREAFANELAHNRYAHYLVAEVDGRVVAYGGMWVIGDEAHVTNIAVHPDYRRRSIGEGLLRRMMDLARRLGATAMTLEVRVSNEPAQRLYRKLGFVCCGVRPRYYQDNQEDALIMWVKLRDDGQTDPRVGH